MSLDGAIAALEQGDPEGALRLLLAAWRPRRTAALGALIQRLGEHLTRTRPPVGGANKQARHDAWLRIEARRDPADFGRLKEAVPLGTRRQQAVQVGLLLQWPDDPRDGKRAPSPPEPGPAEATAYARIAALLDSVIARAEQPTPQALLAAVYAAPDDTDLRLVYADLLDESGDPRGEFIRLQCHRHQGRRVRGGGAREQALLQRHHATWVGGIAPALAPGYTFRRGFVADVQLRREFDVQALGERPGWATVEAIDASRADRLAALVQRAPLRALRELRGIDIATLHALSHTGPHPRIRSLALRLFGGSQLSTTARDQLLSETPGFPGLRQLTLDTLIHRSADRHIRFLAAAPTLRKLETLTDPSGVRLLPRWLKALDRGGVALPCLRLSDPSWRVTASHRGAGWAIEAVCHAVRDHRDQDVLFAALDRLPIASIVALHVRAPAWRGATGRIAKLERAAARFPNLASLELPSA